MCWPAARTNPSNCSEREANAVAVGGADEKSNVQSTNVLPKPCTDRRTRGRPNQESNTRAALHGKPRRQLLGHVRPRFHWLLPDGIRQL